MPVEVQKHLFTVREFHQMAQGGVFGEDDRVEFRRVAVPRARAKNVFTDDDVFNLIS